MPIAYPQEFRERAVELARSGEKPVTQIAADLGIATSCLRRWMKQDDVDGGDAAGSAPTSGRSWCACAVSCAPRRWRSRSSNVRPPTSRKPARGQNDLHLHRPDLQDLPVSVCCRVMKVSTSGFYAWQAKPVTDKDLDDAYLSDTIVDIWTMSRRSYGPHGSMPSCGSAESRCSRKRGSA